MRRFFYWHLPLAMAIVAIGSFGFGFVSYLRGDRGTPVEMFAPAPAATAAPSTTLAPIILGDSLARGTGDESGLGISGRLDAELRRRGIHARRTVNLGINGARTADLLGELAKPNVERLLGEANVIIVSIGGNDLWGGADWRSAVPADAEGKMNEVLERVGVIVEKVRRRNPHARIFLVGLYNPFALAPNGALLAPLVSRWNARLVTRFADDDRITVVQTSDLFAFRDRLALDRFHPSGEGYGLIAARIAESL